MYSLNDCIYDYGKQVEKGHIKTAYQGLMHYIKGLRSYFADKYPEYNVSATIYQGYMDMTFFSLAPKAFKEKDLKVAIVYIHEKTMFEVWLTARNVELQRKYRELFRGIKANKYPVSPDDKGVSSIIESVLVETPDFDDLEALTNLVDHRLVSFIDGIERLLPL